MKSVLVLLNARAGTLIDSGTEQVREQIKSALAGAGRKIDIRLLQPRQMAPAIGEAARSDHDTIVVGGGDGSVSSAAGALAGGGKTLGVLPFGTLNLLARDLGMPAKPMEAIAALACAQPRRIDLASVNGRPFHSLSGLGFFSQMARAREEMRGHPLGRMIGVGLAAIRALRRTKPFALEISADGRLTSVEALAFLVTNNRFGKDWRRGRLDGGVLEVHIAQTKSGLGMLKASADLLTGGWRGNPEIQSFAARELTIGHKRRRAWAATDGELMREAVPLRYDMLPGALTVLAVPGEAVTSSSA
ncbi:MAG: diacylglycerol kinase [Pseudomonadota bacterium]|nr:diacylglycerol kinase [Pseudomonadota bacterium]